MPGKGDKMKAIILAGGFGKRLKPLTEHTPKPLLDVAGVPILIRQIYWLKKHGITDIIISIGYKSEEFKKYVDHIKDVNIVFVTEENPLGTAGAIKNCEKYLDNEHFIVLNGDILTDLDLSKMINIKSHCLIASVKVVDPTSYGTLKINDSKVVSFYEKIKNPSSDWINAGVYILSPDILQLISKYKYSMLENHIFPKMATNNLLHVYKHHGYWIDIGTLDKYYQAYKDIKNGKSLYIESKVSKIKLNIDNWKGLIGRDFTFDNVRRITYGICKYFLEKKELGKVLIGYDTRALGKQFSIEVARIVNHMGFDVYLCDGPTPTPAITTEIKNGEYIFGIVITAGCSPFVYSGIRIKNSCGFTVYDTEKIEEYINNSQISLRANPFKYKIINIKEQYVKTLMKYVNYFGDLPPVIFDNMGGTDWFKTIYPGEIFSVRDSRADPDPIEKNLSLLRENCRLLGYVGIAMDSEGNKISFIDELGNYIGFYAMYSLILNHIKASELVGKNVEIVSDGTLFVLMVLNIMNKNKKKLYELIDRAKK